MTGHDGHILKVALTPFITDGAVMGMVCHQPFSDSLPESSGFRIVYGNPHAIGDWSHARHDDPASRVRFILKGLHRTLTAGAYRMHRRVPTKIGEIKTEAETSLEEILVPFHVEGLVIYEDRRHTRITHFL
jgi:hypothetical protein